MSEYITFNTETQAFSAPPTTPSFKCSGYGLGELIKDMKSPVGLEIGCDIGDTAVFLLESNPTLFLNSIDPYENYMDWNGRMLNDREEWLTKMTERTNKFPGRFKLHRMTSDAAVDSFEDESFDFIFIDGLHTYEQLTIDCANYYPKLKPGGIFAGHDYTVIPGVNKAANEFAAKINKQILTTECDVWYYYK